MRKLATVRTINAIMPHTNADALELTVIDGWQCVVKKGEFKVGQQVAYFEIDSWIPDEIAPFLSKGKMPREYEGVKGERLKTIKLRGELSQGLVIALDALPVAAQLKAKIEGDGCDLSETLNVRKWEKPINPQLAGLARGNFPTFIRKTDQERIQNLFNKLSDYQLNDLYEVSLKLDGSSTTYFICNDRVGVCSRNLELKTDDSNAGNAFVAKFNELGIRDKLLEFKARTGRNIALQGELWGSGINGNWEGISDVRFNVFDIFDIDTYKYLQAGERLVILSEMGLDSVPIISHAMQLNGATLEKLLAYADRHSIYNEIAEGVVFKSLTNPDFSFKIINNKYLLSGGN